METAAAPGDSGARQHPQQRQHTNDDRTKSDGSTIWGAFKNFPNILEFIMLTLASNARSADSIS